MAKLSSINKDQHRRDMIKRFKTKRSTLKTVIMDRETSFEERMDAVFKLSRLPRNSSKVRARNRCMLSGRPRGYHRKFAMSRIAIRDLASNGQIPGMVKASW